MHSLSELCSELDFGILSEFVCLSQFTHNRESQKTDGKISSSKPVAIYRTLSWMFMLQGLSPPWRIYSMCTVVVYFNSPQTVHMLEYSDFPLHCLGVWFGYWQHRYYSDEGVYRHFSYCVFYWCVTLTWLFHGKQHRWGCYRNAEGLKNTYICLVILCRVPLCLVLRLSFGSTNILLCLERNTARDAWILSLNILTSFQAQN